MRSGNILLWDDDGESWILAVVMEAVGAFWLCFIYLKETDPRTCTSNDQAMNSLVVAASYPGARAMLCGVTVTASGAVLNPAIAVGTNFMQLFIFGASHFKWVVLYAGMPFAGSLFAVIFFELFYKRAFLAVKSQHDQEEALRTEEDELQKSL